MIWIILGVGSFAIGVCIFMMRWEAKMQRASYDGLRVPRNTGMVDRHPDTNGLVQGQTSAIAEESHI